MTRPRLERTDADDWGNHEARLRALEIRRRRFQSGIVLFGQEPRQSAALITASTSTTYHFVSGALTASTAPLLPGLNAYVAQAIWNLVVAPNNGGVELVHFEAGPTNIVQIAEVAGNAAATPLNLYYDVTTAMRSLIEITAKGALGGLPNASSFTRHLGHRFKSSGTTSPIVYASRIDILYEA